MSSLDQAAPAPCILSEELDDFRSSVRDFAKKELAPGYLDRALSDEFPWDVYKKLAAQGLIGIEASERYGGQGATHLAAGIAVEELARADMSAAYLVFDTTVGASLLERYYRYAADLLPAVLDGSVSTCLALTEPESGSDAQAMTTVAEKVPGGWRIRGEKASITKAPMADMAVVFAKTDAGPTAFLVDLDERTVSRQRFRDPGMRPIGRGSLTFDNTFAPEERLIGEEGRGFSLVMREFDYSRVLLGLMAVGVGEAGLDMAIAYANERHTFGNPLKAYQGVTFPIAEHLTRLEAARWLGYRALSLRMAGRPHTKEAAMMKWWPVRVALDALEDAMVTFGNVGFADELPLQAMRRDLQGLLIGDGTPQIQKLIISRLAFGR
ncbi:acyl-CoA dehydrogenase family protein [Mycobacterium sp. shizuoka-1]|uniref:acyl-CoA dehydrogenase family protein n=1 Tax=Mycobacteriaceae TaxID=1762 RepID=UPI000C066762|nr:acyl-CoA dehydrogenase family protein [Mycobacterium sp. shizuoka-1]GAY15803.1 acyl-CoA dehydrogenase [Mycobacterium sp. shizuoka-1]